jgi:putative nucleotidyltransferase with HDIG domain
MIVHWVISSGIGAYRRLNDKKGICKTLRNLGVVYVELGEFEEAELNYSEAIEVAEEIDDRMVYADLVNNLGTIMNMKGNQKRALDLYKQSLEIYETNNEIRKSAYTTNNMAITLAEQGMNEEAFKYFKNAYRISLRMKDESLTLIVDINLADIYLKRGELADAKHHCQKAHQYLIDSNLNNGHLVEVTKIAGKIAHHEKDFETAQSCLTEALKYSREISARYLEAEVLLERGTLYREMDKHFDALADLEASYHIYTNLKAEGKKEKTEEVMNSIEELYIQIFESIAKQVEQKDSYTKGHSDRVASLALLLAKELGLRLNTRKTIVAAALLHDIGKIKIDDKIIKKAGKLTADEFQIIKKHPELGVELLRGKEFPWDIKPLVLHHHERINGSGYPFGLKGEDIPMGARIICVADVFDALTSNRVYRSAFDTEKALSIMLEESGSTFDPVILKCFIEMISQGKADSVVNAGTSDDEMYSIWAQCMLEENDQEVVQPALVA